MIYVTSLDGSKLNSTYHFMSVKKVFVYKTVSNEKLLGLSLNRELEQISCCAFSVQAYLILLYFTDTN